MRGLAVSVTDGDHLHARVTSSPGHPGAPGQNTRHAANARNAWLLVGVLGVLGIGGLGAACTPAEARATADQPPAELLVSVAIGPVTTLRNLQAYAEAIQPGTGATLTDQAVRRGLAEAVGASSLDGFDPASGMYLLIAHVDGSPAPALLGKVTDAKTLAASASATGAMFKGSWAVIGAKPVLDRIGPYALATIAPQRAPTAPTATVWLSQVVARYKTEIEAVRSQMMASIAQPSAGRMTQFMTSYLDGLGSFITDADKLIVTLEVTPDLGSLDFALLAKPGSRLAKFVALQRPGDYALLDRLPAATPSVLLGGHLEVGPYRDGILETIAAMYGSDASKELLAAMDAFRKAMTGDIAMTIQSAPGTGLAFTQLFRLSDAAAAQKAITAILDLFKVGRSIEAMGMTTTIKTNPATTMHDGVALRSYEATYDLSKVEPAQRKAMEAMLPSTQARAQIATFDALGLVVLAPDSLAEAGLTIDAARGKAPHFVAPTLTGELLAASRARKDSLAMMMDLGALLAKITGRAPTVAAPILISLGCADHNAHLRLALPAVTLRAAVNGGNP